MGIEKTIFGQNAFSKSCFPWSMLPEKPRHTSGFHKKVFMKRPTGHQGTWVGPVKDLGMYMKALMFLGGLFIQA